MREEYEVGNEQSKLSEGEYYFTIEKTKLTKDNKYRIWELTTMKNGYPEKTSILLVPWKAIDLLVTLGYKQIIVEENGKKKPKIIWETEDVIGKHFHARLSYNENGYAELSDYRAEITEQDLSGNTEDVPF